MKKLFALTIILLVLFSNVYSNGVGVISAKDGICLQLISSQIEVSVENQIAVVITSQTFQNTNSDTAVEIKYVFPLSEEASATNLRWMIDGIWYQAVVSPTPQDSTMPGPSGEIDPNLEAYMGETPLYFAIEQEIQPESIIIVELTYVELLNYKFGDVNFSYPNDYSLIQSEPLELQQLNFTLTSPRTIEDIELLSSQPVTSLSNDGNMANLQCSLDNVAADEDYIVRYSLSLDELGLFGMSTMIPDSLVPDEYGGFFLFAAEPDPSETTESMDKVFTLIIDRSGSMGGNKIVQARGAASFIVEHLNEGDKFNIVDFSGDVKSFREAHVEYNPINKDAALSYISGINANGMTNISGAFSLAVPQFATANDTTANIIIFFTDGRATEGITNTDTLADHVHNLVVQSEKNISIFTFGIGDYTNERLLTLLATQNNGLAEFLGNDELESRITEFYLLIRNPVLLNTELTFSSPSISETYPNPLPNLYQGSQMIVSGRYLEATPTTVTLSGTAFGNSVTYEYSLQLADSAVEKNQFLTKIWAKQKIEYLLIQYNLLPPYSSEAEALKEQIIEISLAYGVISPFTSFDPPPTGVEEDEMTEKKNTIPISYELLNNYPNPFNSSTKIRFRVNVDLNQMIKVRIYNSLGQLIAVLALRANGTGIYEIEWNGFTLNGEPACSGLYLYAIDFGDAVLVGKMNLLK